jgi:hypothetical protein
VSVAASLIYKISSDKRCTYKAHTVQGQLGGQLAQHVSSEKWLDTPRDDEGFVHAQFGNEAGEERVALVGREGAE